MNTIGEEAMRRREKLPMQDARIRKAGHKNTGDVGGGVKKSPGGLT